MPIRAKLTELLTNMAQSLLSFSFNLGGLIAGGTLALYLDVFTISPWVIALFPCALSMKGAIGGLFSGRLSTALHLGTMKAGYKNNTKSFYLLFASIVTLAFMSSIIIGSAAFIFSFFLWRIPSKSYIEMLAVISGTMGLSVLFVSLITMEASFLSFKRGLDPDVVVYPITSTTADIVVTLCYVTVLEAFFLMKNGFYLIYLIDLIFMAAVLIILARNSKEAEFLKTLREFFLTLLIVTVVVNITGSVLSGLKETIGGRIEIYAIYPAMIDTMGDFGSVIGSTTTTKLFTGLIQPSFSSMKSHLTEIFSTWTASAIMFIIYMGIASIGYGINLAEYPSFLAELLTTNIMTAFFMAFITYATAILTFRHALDPDNFVIPIESSIADAITTIFLFVSLTLFS